MDSLFNNAAYSGKTIRRQRTDISIKTRGKILQLPALVSVSGFTFEETMYALMVIEDISELVELQSFLSICSSCKKIRTEDDQWEKGRGLSEAAYPGLKSLPRPLPGLRQKALPRLLGPAFLTPRICQGERQER